MFDDWIAVKDQPPSHKEPVVYARPHPRHPGRWSVGLAYWTVSEKWNPEAESEQAPRGFTHWKHLGDPPGVRRAPGYVSPNLLQRALDTIKLMVHGRDVMTAADHARARLTIEDLQQALFGADGVDVPDGAQR